MKKNKSIKYAFGFCLGLLLSSFTNNSFSQTVILQETFESRTTAAPGAGWTLDPSACSSGGVTKSRWNIGTGGAGNNVAIAGSKSLGIGPSNSTGALGYTADACAVGTGPGPEIYAAYVFNTVGKTNIVITFKWKCTGEWNAGSGGEYRDYGRFYCYQGSGVQYEFSTDGWINYANTYAAANKGAESNTGYFWNYGSSVNNGTGNLGTGGYKWQSYYLPSFMNGRTAAEIGFEWRNNGTAAGSGFIIDDITISSGGAVFLPIDLINFEATTEGKKVSLLWNTASEINNDFYTLERSQNGIDYVTLKTVKGAGNSTSTLSYEVFDEKPLSGPNYYRLKQTDFDGKFSYYETKVVNYYKDEFYCNEPSPNPAESNVNINFYAPFSTTANIQVIDIMGRTVINKSVDVSKGEQLISTELNEIKSGAYYFNISIEGESYFCTKRLIKN